MNSDSANKAHNKVKTLFSLPEALSCLRKLKNKNTKTTLDLAPGASLMDCASRFCLPPPGSQNMKETNSQSNSGNSRLFVGRLEAREQLSFLCQWQKITSEVSCSYLCCVSSRLSLLSHSLSFLLSVERGQETELRPLMFVCEKKRLLDWI